MILVIFFQTLSVENRSFIWSNFVAQTILLVCGSKLLHNQSCGAILSVKAWGLIAPHLEQLADGPHYTFTMSAVFLWFTQFWHKICFVVIHAFLCRAKVNLFFNYKYKMYEKMRRHLTDTTPFDPIFKLGVKSSHHHLFPRGQLCLEAFTRIHGSRIKQILATQDLEVSE